MLLVLPDELLFVTDGRYGEQAARPARPRPASTRDIEIGLTMAAQHDDPRRAPTASAAPRARGATRVTLGRAARVWRATWFPRDRAGADRGPRRVAARGQGRAARSRASRRPRRSPTTRSPSVRDRARRATPPSTTFAPRARHRDPPARRRGHVASRRSSGPVRTAPSRTHRAERVAADRATATSS